ncbi:MAG: hypothetical protein HFE84_02290 [Lachnospiraceae bacterium]|jgi:hydrogenase expression/formation protein HypE|nr:hypothetical protein [Lachnospiraceae bacterium]
MMRKIVREPNGPGRFDPEQELVVVGAIGKAGVAAALLCKRDELKRRFRADFLETVREKTEETLGLTPNLLMEYKATEWEIVSEGGVFAALWRLSGAYMRGLSVSLTAIPVHQELLEVCELFDLNPYRLASGECLLLVADNGGALAAALKERGLPAAVIGVAEKGIARKIWNSGRLGYLERPQPDEIYKITDSKEDSYA